MDTKKTEEWISLIEDTLDLMNKRKSYVEKIRRETMCHDRETCLKTLAELEVLISARSRKIDRIKPYDLFS